MPPKARAGAPGTSALPTKESALFKRLIQEYETKKYKLGLKTADAILKKFPEHGETLCMKGLILASTGDRPAGLELAKQGVRKDLMSFISWHALGILNRLDKNYYEAIKCYTQALRIEGGTNLNLIRESSYMHMQSRNYSALIEGRTTLLRMQPHIRSNWAALATAYHLSGQLVEAEKVLGQWEEACRDIPTKSYEHSEMLLYRASILFESGKFQETVDYLASVAGKIVDKRAARVMTAKAQLELGHLQKAEPLWRKLVEENEEDKGFVAGWVRSKGGNLNASAADPTTVEALRELQGLFPKSQATKRMELIYLSGRAFADALELYLSRALTKGVPSIFADIKSLLAEPEKRSTTEKVALALLQKYSPSTSSDEPPSSYLWTLYFLAQYYSHIGHAETALDFIQSAIAHTPTLPELYMTKARILKRAGALEAASHAMEDARLLDGQDRFLNSKDAKYKLRTGQIDEAESVMGLFTKPDAASPFADLLEMQALWFVLEEGVSHEASGNLHIALKRYAQVEKLFEDHWDDQLDFHSYCVRKFTMRDYADMCRWEDGVRGHSVYIEACLRATAIYIAVHDDGKLSDPSAASATGKEGQANGSANGMTEDQKKEAKRLKKLEAKKREEEEKRKQKQAAEKAAKQKASGNDDEEMNQPPPDPDPEGVALLQSKAPLLEAERLVKNLQLHAGRDARVWVATFELALRSNNWLLAARALRKTSDLLSAGSDTGLASEVQATRRDIQGRHHVQRLQLLALMPDLAGAPEEVRAGIDTALDVDAIRSPAKGEVSLDRLNDDFLQKTGDVISHARAKIALAAAASKSGNAAVDTQAVTASLVHLAEGSAASRGQPHAAQTTTTTLSTLLSAWYLLQPQPQHRANVSTRRPILPAPHLPTTYAPSKEQLEAFRSAAHAAVPLAEVFLTQEEGQARREARRTQRRDWEARAEGEDGVPA